MNEAAESVWKQIKVSIAKATRHAVNPAHNLRCLGWLPAAAQHSAATTHPVNPANHSLKNTAIQNVTLLWQYLFIKHTVIKNIPHIFALHEGQHQTCFILLGWSTRWRNYLVIMNGIKQVTYLENFFAVVMAVNLLQYEIHVLKILRICIYSTYSISCTKYNALVY